MILQKWHNDGFCFYEFVINSRKHITQNNEMKRIFLRVTHANLPSVCILKSLFQSIQLPRFKDPAWAEERTENDEEKQNAEEGHPHLIMIVHCLPHI